VLEIAAALVVATIAIEFDGIAGTFTGSATIFTTFLWWAGTTGIFAFI
jgi:hypothetical protein